jgi:hypothetical protein
MFDTLILILLFILHRSVGFPGLLFYFSLRYGRIHRADDVAGVPFSRPGLFGAGFRQSKTRRSWSSTFKGLHFLSFRILGFMWTYLLVMRYMLFDALSSLSCDASLYCNGFILRCL